MTSLLKPEVTLIVTSSVDGCLGSRDSDSLDQNKGWKDSNVVRGLVQQFFDFSHNSDIYNLTTGETMVRIGLNNEIYIPKKTDLRLIIIDFDDELSFLGVSRLANSVEKLILVTHHRRRDLVRKLLPKNCRIIIAGSQLPIVQLMNLLVIKCRVKKITIQSAGFLNNQWMSANIVDYLSVILYPLIVNKNGTPTFAGLEWFPVKPLQLISSQVFDTNYLSLRYKVLNI